MLTASLVAAKPVQGRGRDNPDNFRADVPAMPRRVHGVTFFTTVSALGLAMDKVEAIRDRSLSADLARRQE
jgi:hypothetical protein